MSEDWRPVIRALIYGIEYERDMPTRAQRVFQGIALAPEDAIATPGVLRAALAGALSSTEDLPTLYEIAGERVALPHSDEDLRVMLAQLAEKLDSELAETGAAAPRAGYWVPATYEDHEGIDLAQGEPLPAHAEGRWWRLASGDAADASDDE